VATRDSLRAYIDTLRALWSGETVRHLRFHLHDLLAPSNSADDLLSEIDRDPTTIFWG
jgi:Protein of unknown function (DUF3024)